MVLKFIQLNLFKGKFLDEAISYLEKSKADIFALQEVTARKFNFYQDKSAILFDILKTRLGYDGVSYPDAIFVDDPGTSFGNAILTRLPIIKTHTVVLKSFRPVTLHEMNHNPGNIWAELPRHMLDVVVDAGHRQVHAISVHGRRIAPPFDDKENLRQAELMANYLTSLDDEPFIMGGDLNMPPDTKVIDKISSVSQNLMRDLTSQTTNPRIHFLKNKGYLIDFIFTSKHFKVKRLEIEQVDVSDHLPVVAELEF